MKNITDTVWQRRGTTWLWNEEARNMVCKAGEVWSLRQFLQTAVPNGNGWPEDLPSNDDQTLVVAGLEGSLDVLDPEQAEIWLEDTIKHAILSFQDAYGGEAALIFWLPQGEHRLEVKMPSDAVSWLCEATHRDHQLDFGRLLWGEASEYPQKILLHSGDKPAGLFHLPIT